MTHNPITFLFPIVWLGQQIKFWETIHAPQHILTALKEGIDIGLIDDIESLLPKNGINKPNMKWESQPCPSSHLSNPSERIDGPRNESLENVSLEPELTSEYF